jgi:hypothetical protein
LYASMEIAQLNTLKIVKIKGGGDEKEKKMF